MFEIDKDKKKIRVLDLYCGLGGLSLGLQMTGGFRVIGGIDNFDWAVKTFYHNHTTSAKLITKPQDMAELEPADVLDDLGENPDVIVGGPPCQGFSHAGKRLDDMKHDKRNHQVFHFLRFIQEIRPKAFIMENVSGITMTGQKKKNQLISDLVDAYTHMGYKVTTDVLNSADYRVPQNRKRFILVGLLDSKNNFSFPIAPCSQTDSLFSKPPYTVGEALDDMPSPIAEEPQEYDQPPRTPLQKFLRNNSETLHNHLVTKHSPEMIEKLAAQQVGTRLYPTWNHSWYRLDPKRPSPAVKENHRAPFVHFAEHRATSPRECARLQTVPDSYILLGTKTAQLIMVGNAVPAVMAAHLGTALAKQHFSYDVPVPWSENHNPINNGQQLDRLSI